MSDWPYKIVRETPEVITIEFGHGNFKFLLVPKSDNPATARFHIGRMIEGANLLHAGDHDSSVEGVVIG